MVKILHSKIPLHPPCDRIRHKDVGNLSHNSYPFHIFISIKLKIYCLIYRFQFLKNDFFSWLRYCNRYNIILTEFECFDFIIIARFKARPTSTICWDHMSTMISCIISKLIVIWLYNIPIANTDCNPMACCQFGYFKPEFNWFHWKIYLWFKQCKFINIWSCSLK